MKSYFFKPGNNKDKIEKLIQIFKHPSNLHIAVAYFNSDIFAELILNRFEKRYNTFLLVNTSDLLRPQEIGDSEIAISQALMKVILADKNQNYIHIRSLGIRAKGKYQNMHHKFYLNQETVLFGSLNLTNAALNRNFETLFEISNQKTIKDFFIEFGDLWEKGAELYSGRDNELRSLMCPICEINDGVDFESYGPFCTFCGHKFSIK